MFNDHIQTFVSTSKACSLAELSVAGIDRTREAANQIQSEDMCYSKTPNLEYDVTTRRHNCPHVSTYQAHQNYVVSSLASIDSSCDDLFFLQKHKLRSFAAAWLALNGLCPRKVNFKFCLACEIGVKAISSQQKI